MTRATACCVLLASSCAASATALVDGVAVPRQQHGYTGQPYQIRHDRAHPRPGGPSGGLSDDGGSITGKVCGMDVTFDAGIVLGGFGGAPTSMPPFTSAVHAPQD